MITAGSEPLSAPGIHDLPASPATRSTNAALQAQVKSRTTAIRYHLMADVLYAVAGSVSGIPVLGPAVGHALSAWADTLEAQAIDAMNSANNAQSSANYANLQLSLLMSGTLASSVPGGVSVDYQFDGGSANDLGSDWSRDSGGPGGGHYGPNGSGRGVWKKFGGLWRRHIDRYNTPLATDYQVVVCIMSTPVQSPSLGGDAHNYLCARMNSSGDTFVWADIGNDTVAVGRVDSGSWSTWDSTSITANPGDQWQFLVGTTADDRQVIIKQNGVARIVYTDTTHAFGSGYRYVGLGAQAAERNVYLTQTLPGELDLWAAADRLPSVA